jgi:hypothetical protein
MQKSTTRLSKSSPLRCVSPAVAFTSKVPSVVFSSKVSYSFVRRETSKVPPPLS